MSKYYENPLNTRYASDEIKQIFSPDFKFSTWRRLWLALAEAEKELGLDITEEQLSQMREHLEDIDYDLAAEYEKKFRHDVMAHVHTFGEAAPKAKGIIHLGATSAFVGDNTDVIQYYQALLQVRRLLINLIKNVRDFVLNYKDLATLGFTHFQPAQLTTVGKRAGLWLQDLMSDLEDLDYLISTVKLRGAKGTTGTQASFLELFNGDETKVLELDKKVCNKMGFDDSFSLTGQTYPRKLDTRILNVLSGIAQTLLKFATEIRLLQHLKEIEEPFEKSQIGSSAMAYKRNPMRTERICSLARYVIIDSLNPAFTYGTQWFERTLDDSANKRISIPEAFMATDAILSIAINVTDGLVVHKEMIKKHIAEELPFMVTENILMEAVKKGGDRQELHEKIRTLSMDAAYNVKEKGEDNNLVELIKEDPAFAFIKDDIDDLLDPDLYTGLAAKQVEAYVKEIVDPVLEENKDLLLKDGVELKV